MELDIFFAEDIRNTLLAANEASAATAAMILSLPIAPTAAIAVSVRAYREGYKAALATIALAFGIAPSMLVIRGDEQGPALSDAESPNLPHREKGDKLFPML